MNDEDPITSKYEAFTNVCDQLIKVAYEPDNGIVLYSQEDGETIWNRIYLNKKEADTLARMLTEIV